MQEEEYSEISNEIDRQVPRLLARELSSILSMQFKKTSPKPLIANTYLHIFILITAIVVIKRSTNQNNLQSKEAKTVSPLAHGVRYDLRNCPV